MDLAIHIPNFSFAGRPASTRVALAQLAETAEGIGCADVSVMDHYFQMENLGGPEHDMLEGYTVLGFLAAVTERVRLGLLVTGVTYRWPGLLGKIVTTLDVLTCGRAQLGIGAAWYEREHEGLGVPFPARKIRYEQLEETLQICKQLWSDDDGPYDGKHFQLAETINVPQCISSPHPPIMIGGEGERKTLRLVARYADACNLFTHSGVDGVRHKLEVLRRHCDTEGRDYDTIRKTVLHTSGGFPTGEERDRFVSEMEGYAALGIEEVYLMPSGDNPVAEVAGMEAYVQRLEELG